MAVEPTLRIRGSRRELPGSWVEESAAAHGEHGSGNIKGFAGGLFDGVPRPAVAVKGVLAPLVAHLRPLTASSARADGAHGAELGALAR